MPTPALSDPAAVLPGEADLLAAVLADLAADTPKLVYADWLDDHGDPARAAHLRAFAAALRTGDPPPPAAALPKGWRELVGVTLVERARKHGFAGRAGAFLGLARPGFAVKARKAADARLAVGASKFGGSPDLPDDLDWPARDDDRPLAFLAQLNLADLAGSPAARDLPPAGLFSVFYDAADEDGEAVDEPDGWRFLHLPAPPALARRDLPTELGDESRFAACRLTFAEALMLPDAESPWEAALGLDDEAEDRYQEAFVYPAGPAHRLLGYPIPIQEDMLGKKSVRHLLTIDSDDGPGWMWGDSGSLYVLIADKDLKARRFDKVWLDMQCS